MRRRAVFVAIVALLAGGIPAVRSLDPWERASGDASEIVESSLSSSSSSSSLRDGNDGDGDPATRTTDASVLAPPAARLYPPGTGAYAPPGEGSARSGRRKGYENTIAAQIEKAIDAEFRDEDDSDGVGPGGGSARGDGLGDGSAALLVGDGSAAGAVGSKFESERREEGAVLERVVVVSGKGKGEAEVVVAKKGNVAKARDDDDDDDDDDEEGEGDREEEGDGKDDDDDRRSKAADEETGNGDDAENEVEDLDYAERHRRRRGEAAPPPPPGEPSASSRGDVSGPDTTTVTAVTTDTTDAPSDGSDPALRTEVSHASAGNRAHGISVDEENESVDDVHLAQRLAADERLRRAEHFLSDVGHVIRDVDDVLTGKIIDKKMREKEEEDTENDSRGGNDGTPGADAGADEKKKRVNADDAEQVLRIVDAKHNEFVVSSTKASAYELSTDMRLIVDLIEVYVAAAIGAFVFVHWLGHPPFGGVVLAGMCVGPSGLDVVGEVVQVTTLAQIGVLLPLFARGAELAVAARERRYEPNASSASSSSAPSAPSAPSSKPPTRLKTFADAFGPFGVACVCSGLGPAFGTTPAVGALFGATIAFSSTETMLWGRERPRGGERTRTAARGRLSAGASRGFLRGGGGDTAANAFDAAAAGDLYARVMHRANDDTDADADPPDRDAARAIPPAVSSRLALHDWSLGPTFVLVHAVAGARTASDAFVNAVGYKLRSTALACVVTAVAVTAASPACKRVMARPFRGGSGTELAHILTVSACLAASFLSHRLELGMEAGAFVGGVAAGAAFGRGQGHHHGGHHGGHHGHRGGHGAEGDDSCARSRSVADAVDPVRRMFETLQLVTVGIVCRPEYVWGNLSGVALGLGVLVLCKTFVGGCVVSVFDGCPKDAAWALAGIVAVAGDFSFAMLFRAHQLGALGKETFRAALAVCVVSVMMAPVLNHGLVPWLARGGRRRRRRF